VNYPTYRVYQFYEIHGRSKPSGQSGFGLTTSLFHGHFVPSHVHSSPAWIVCDLGMRLDCMRVHAHVQWLLTIDCILSLMSHPSQWTSTFRNVLSGSRRQCYLTSSLLGSVNGDCSTQQNKTVVLEDVGR